MPESFDTAIVNGTVVAGTLVAPATVAIRDGRIAAMLDRLGTAIGRGR